MNDARIRFGVRRGLALLLLWAAAATNVGAGDAKGSIEPLTVSPKASTKQEFQTRRLAWCNRVWVEPFKKRVAGAEHEKETIAFVEGVLPQWVGLTANDRSPAEFAKQGQLLLTNGCQDPLVMFLAAWSDFKVNNYWRSAEAVYLKLHPRMASNSVASSSLGVAVAVHYSKVLVPGNCPPDHWGRDGVARLQAAVKEGAYDGEDGNWMFVRDATRELSHETLAQCSTQMVEICQSPQIGEWARKTVLGCTELSLAWKARGTDWASKVKPQGWKGWEEHLQKARTLLVDAWKLRPDRSEAAVLMIEVAMGGVREGDETERLWFDRAIAAQFDDELAYSNLLWAYRPRWGGSHELMFALGQACLATRRYDTDVPLVYASACNDIAQERQDWREFYSLPQVAKPLMELSEGMFAEPKRQGEKNKWRSYLVANAWLVRDYKLADEHLSLVTKLDPFAAKRLQRYGADETLVRREVALYCSPGKASFDEGNALLDSGDLKQARDAFTKALETVKPDAKPMVQGRLRVVEAEEALATGEWVKITPDPSLDEWHRLKGDWSVDDKGGLVIRGDDGVGAIVHQAKVGPDFELRCEVEIVARDHCCRALGIIFGWEESTREYRNCLLGQGGRGPTLSMILMGAFESKEPRGKPLKFAKGPNRFHLRCQDGRLTFIVNDTTLREEHALTRITAGPADGRVGFGSPRFCQMNTTTVRNIEVRRLGMKPNN